MNDQQAQIRPGSGPLLATINVDLDSSTVAVEAPATGRTAKTPVNSYVSNTKKSVALRRASMQRLSSPRESHEDTDNARLGVIFTPMTRVSSVVLHPKKVRYLQTYDEHESTTAESDVIAKDNRLGSIRNGCATAAFGDTGGNIHVREINQDGVNDNNGRSSAEPGKYGGHEVENGAISQFDLEHRLECSAQSDSHNVHMTPRTEESRQTRLHPNVLTSRASRQHHLAVGAKFVVSNPSDTHELNTLADRIIRPNLENEQESPLPPLKFSTSSKKLFPEKVDWSMRPYAHAHDQARQSRWRPALRVWKPSLNTCLQSGKYAASNKCMKSTKDTKR